MNTSKVSLSSAGYEELVGAKKDANCNKVNVPGGVSTNRGCCCLWERSTRYVTEFRCGTCEYSTKKSS